METKIAVFKGKRIRRVIHDNEWWFSVVDVCEVLTESPGAGAYWRKLKQRLKKEGSEVVTFCHGLKLVAAKLEYHALLERFSISLSVCTVKHKVPFEFVNVSKNDFRSSGLRSTKCHVMHVS